MELCEFIYQLSALICEGVAFNSVVAVACWQLFLRQKLSVLLIEVFCFVLTTRFKWKGLVLSVGGLLVISFIVTAVIIGHYDLSVVLFGMGG